MHTEATDGAPAPVHAPHRTDPEPKRPPTWPRPHRARAAGPTDAELLDAVQRHAAEHGGEPLGQREIRRATEEAFGRPVGFGRAKRLQELAGWAEPTAPADSDGRSVVGWVTCLNFTRTRKRRGYCSGWVHRLRTETRRWRRGPIHSSIRSCGVIWNGAITT